MNSDLESNRITLSLGFITAFLALFWGVDFISQNKLIYGIKGYAFISSALFFFYLLFTAISYKYKKDSLIEVGIGYDKIYFTNEEIEKFRKWSYDAGINCVFAAIFVPFYLWLFQYTNNIKTLLAIVLILLIFQCFFSAIKYFFKTSFFRTTIFTIATLMLMAFTGLLNNDAKTLIELKKVGAGQVIKQNQVSSDSNSTLWPTIVNFVAGKNDLSN